MANKKHVILNRGIWYVTTLLSIIGLSISLNLLYPPGKSSSRFLRDFAVSVTTFYALTLLRFFFIDPPPPPSEFIITKAKRAFQGIFSLLALDAVMGSSLKVYYNCREDNSKSCKEFGLILSLFVVSLFTGGLGLIQLSPKLRMEIRHALFILFLGWLFCLLGIAFAFGFCIHYHVAVSISVLFLQALLCVALAYKSIREHEVSPLPT